MFHLNSAIAALLLWQTFERDVYRCSSTSYGLCSLVCCDSCAVVYYITEHSFVLVFFPFFQPCSLYTTVTLRLFYWLFDFFAFNFVFSRQKMSSTPSTPSKLSSQSSCSEKTPSSGISCNKRAYKKTYNSPSLRAFNTFTELLEKLVDYVRKKIE